MMQISPAFCHPERNLDIIERKHISEEQKIPEVGYDE